MAFSSEIGYRFWCSSIHLHGIPNHDDDRLLPFGLKKAKYFMV